jgi:hypothetical protein
MKASLHMRQLFEFENRLDKDSDLLSRSLGVKGHLDLPLGGQVWSPAGGLLISLSADC